MITALMFVVPLLAAQTPTPLQVFNREHEPIVSVTTAAVGSDLRLTANFPKPVKSYLKEEYDNLALEFHVDSDNNDAVLIWTQDDVTAEGIVAISGGGTDGLTTLVSWWKEAGNSDFKRQ